MTAADDRPRLGPLPRAEWDDRLTKLLAASPGGTEEPMHIFTTLAHQPDLFRRWLGFGGALLAGTLPGRLRELVILRTACRFDGRYEWAHHIELGAAQGITADELAALGGDLDLVAWDPFERAALAAVDQTADEGAVADGTWATLAARLSDGELVEFLMLLAHYLMLSTVLRSLRVPLEPAALAWAEGVPGGPAA
ncbi:MAG TPA: carboxymuconolactone decarboxylase family protein [Acidimicrobiales bacterium]|jgi:alkylhydroperoxidase family enzyme